MEQLNEQTNIPVMTHIEYTDHILYVSKLETMIASLLKAKEHDNKVIEALIRTNYDLQKQHDEDTKLLINNPLNATKEYNT